LTFIRFCETHCTVTAVELLLDISKLATLAESQPSVVDIPVCEACDDDPAVKHCGNCKRKNLCEICHKAIHKKVRSRAVLFPPRFAPSKNPFGRTAGAFS
jgi:hypothetical protein